MADPPRLDASSAHQAVSVTPHPTRRPRRQGSLLLASSAARMARVSIAVAVIWLATGWAFGAWANLGGAGGA